MFLYKKNLGRVAFNMRPARGPWGGSSPFVVQLKHYLQKRGYDVCFDLKKKVDVIVLIDPRDDLQFKSFGMDEIRAYKKDNPKVKVLHRINECDQRKNSSFMDELLKKVFQGASSIAMFSMLPRCLIWTPSGNSDKMGSMDILPHPVIIYRKMIIRNHALGM